MGPPLFGRTGNRLEELRRTWNSISLKHTLSRLPGLQEFAMEITEVRIKLMDGNGEDRLLGFCSITIDHAFVVRDLKIIRGTKGAFVAMPSRKLTDRCPGCGGKNQLRAAYCNYCGRSLADDRSFKQPDGKAKLYADIAHPIHSDCRDLIQEEVIKAYEQELILSEGPEYVCKYDDFGEFDDLRNDDAHDADVDGFGLSMSRRLTVRQDHPQSQQSPHRSGQVAERVERADDFGSGLF